MDLLTGKEVANKIKENILKDMEILKEKKKVLPHLALFSMGKDEASLVYVRKIEQNCKKYGINISIFFAKTEEEFNNCINELYNHIKCINCENNKNTDNSL